MEIALTKIQWAIRQATLELPDLHSTVKAFGETRGWSETTMGSVHRSVAILLALRREQFRFDRSALEHLAGFDGCVGPTLDFLAETGLLMVDPEAGIDLWLGERLHRLPEQIGTEVRSWLEVLRGRSKRRRKPHRPNTVKAYLRVCGPCLEEWSQRYDSLRQVTTEDIQEQLVGHSQRERVNMLVGMRSLFCTLKANRLVFADPTAGIRVKAPSHGLPLAIGSVAEVYAARSDGSSRLPADPPARWRPCPDSPADRQPTSR